MKNPHDPLANPVFFLRKGATSKEDEKKISLVGFASKVESGLKKNQEAVDKIEKLTSAEKKKLIRPYTAGGNF